MSKTAWEENLNNKKLFIGKTIKDILFEDGSFTIVFTDGSKMLVTSDESTPYFYNE